MPTFERSVSRARSSGRDLGHREVLARLLDITRRHVLASRAPARLPVCDGAGFEDRLHARLLTLAGDRVADVAHRFRDASPLRPPGRRRESRRLEEPDGLVAWIELDALEAIDASRAAFAADDLREIVRATIEGCAGTGDAVLGQYGPESFAWMHSGAMRLEQAVALADAALESLSAPCRVAGTDRALRPSLGFTYFPQDGTSVTMLLTRACAAMRRARHYGMGYAFYSPILDAAFAIPARAGRRVAHNAARARTTGAAASSAWA